MATRISRPYGSIGSIRDPFSLNDHHHHLQRTIRVDPITLGENDHHGHLEGSLGYPGPLTLPQNSIGSLRGDVRLDLCQSGLFSVPVGSVCASQVTRVRIHKIFLDHFRLDRSVFWLFRGCYTTLDDPRNWSTPTIGQGGPHYDVSLF
ncbi:hypothetical protein CRG98_007322 [Punica granatum]|uniref:Uncharacterized protein n=1 Tax=Punica granatum TaxID=22663 RepID=A0A2I0KUV4_PUNGR|nr:hypothetical protein CRG98_007322 [Punica granatum]